MKLRILIFEDESSIRRPICTFLRAQGYEVFGYPSPAVCALVSESGCECPQEHACADILITDMNMPEMTGLELIRLMAEKGCCVPPQNKIVISNSVTAEQREEFVALGCHFLPKPFQLGELLNAVKTCAKNVPPDRTLIPSEILEANL